MLYAYPTGITPAVVEAIQETANFLPYLDLLYSTAILRSSRP
jgi:ribosomal protein S12 methylthiotransferase